MDWTNLLLAVGLVYIAYEAGRWSQRQDFNKQAELQFVIMKAFEKAREDKHYQDIVDHNEEMEKAKEDYEKGNMELWEQIQKDQAEDLATQIAERIEKDDNKKDDDRTNEREAGRQD